MSDYLDKDKVIARLFILLNSGKHVCDIGAQLFNIFDEINDGKYDAEVYR